MSSRLRRSIHTALLAAVAALVWCGVGYGGYVALTWLQYGLPGAPPDQCDALLDQFMPVYEVVEHHDIRVAAPADVTFEAEQNLDLQRSTLVRTIFRAREIVMRAHTDETVRPTGLLAFMKSIGWGELAEVPHREIVMGGVTKPWEPNPVFRALPPEQFAAFNDPGYVKIVWMFRADPIGKGISIASTETRVITTDAAARSQFRLYWAKVSPGILLIRHMGLRVLRREAEDRARLKRGITT